MTESKQKSIFTPERTLKFFIVNYVILAIAAMIVWPLLDILFDAISQKPFIWTVQEHIIAPLIFAFIASIIEFIFWNFFHKPTKTKK